MARRGIRADSDWVMENSQPPKPSLLVLVLERYHAGQAGAVYDRLRRRGRLLPNGIRLVDAWVDVQFSRGFMLLDVSHPSQLDTWALRWADLMQFEFIPVRTGAEAFAIAADWESTKHLGTKDPFTPRQWRRIHDGGAVTEIIIQRNQHWFDAAVLTVGNPPRLLGGALDRDGAALVSRTQLEALDHRQCGDACDRDWCAGDE